MTADRLRRMAIGIAITVQAAMVLTYGTLTNWCFCSHSSGLPEPAVPPVYLMRFMDLAVLHVTWMRSGHAVPLIVLNGVVTWGVAMLVLLHGMALVARVRVRPVRDGPGGRRVWLAGLDHVRPWQMLLLSSVLIGSGLSAGATARHRWLSEAEQVFAATMAAARADRPLPPGVEFSMWEWRGNDMVDVKPEARFTVEADPRESGDHFLDRFVVPYGYGGVLRFESGRRYRFLLYRSIDGWGIHINQSPSRERR